METFAFSPPINNSVEGKWLLAVTSSEATNSVFNKTHENFSFANGTRGYCRIPNYLSEGIIDRLKELLKLRSENVFELHFKEVEKKVLE